MKHLLAAALILTGATAMSATFEQSLMGSEWMPLEITGQPRAQDNPAFLQFGGEGRVSGSTGCNRFSGSFTAAGGALTFSPLATTRRACLPDLMELERDFLAALEAVTGYTRDGIGLILTGKDGATVMALRQTDAD